MSLAPRGGPPRAGDMYVSTGEEWLPLQAPQTQWAVLRFEENVEVDTTAEIRQQVRSWFRPRWLIVATRGFMIRLVVSHQRLLLEEVDGDLFTGASWDVAASIGQLERFRIPDFGIDVGNELQLRVTPRPRLLSFKGQKLRFSAMVIGEEQVSRH